jgi:hypothetical protein
MSRSRDAKRNNRRKSRTEVFLASLTDVEDNESLPADLAPWQVAAIRHERRQIELAVAEDQKERRVYDEADEGMPRGTPLVTGGRVHVRYKATGGYTRYFVPHELEIPCEIFGCCDPTRRD